MLLFFFFQAEDGIRDVAVTGVQTCALPISYTRHRPIALTESPPAHGRRGDAEIVSRFRHAVVRQPARVRRPVLTALSCTHVDLFHEPNSTTTSPAAGDPR